MPSLLRRLWFDEPVRLIGIVASILSELLVTLGSDAPRWFELLVPVVVLLSAELARSRVTPMPPEYFRARRE